jgi:hypothetical protein
LIDPLIRGLVRRRRRRLRNPYARRAWSASSSTSVNAAEVLAIAETGAPNDEVRASVTGCASANAAGDMSLAFAGEDDERVRAHLDIALLNIAEAPCR